METERRPVQKKAYARPEIETEQVFETLALACCKVQGFGCGNTGLGATVSGNAS